MHAVHMNCPISQFRATNRTRLSHKQKKCMHSSKTNVPKKKKNAYFIKLSFVIRKFHQNRGRES